MTNVIEHNVPVPKRVKSGKWILLAEKMKAGDSVKMTKVADLHSFAQAFRNLGVAYKGQTKPELRIWRLK